MPINGKTAVVGLMGWPVSHSFSPAMHNAAAAALGLNLVYVPLPTPPDRVAEAVRGLRALGFLGANVTIPHKQAVLPLLDEIDAGARATGAVNTIVVRDGQLRGANTDITGFSQDLQALGVPVAGRRALILGAGGSARAVAYALGMAGATVTVLARRPAQAHRLAADLAPFLPPAHTPRVDSWDALAAHAAADLIVNTTPLGMNPHDDASPWPRALPLPPHAFVYDLVYNPPCTPLLHLAARAGISHANGLGMLLRQGAAAFTLWTGRAPDLNVMAAALPLAQ